MFSSAVLDLRGRGVDCVYALPRGGFRAWHRVMCLSSRTEGHTKDAAYENMNWWLSGWPGAFIARHGYNTSNPQRSRPHLAAAEWDYSYMGKPAAASPSRSVVFVLTSSDHKRDIDTAYSRNVAGYALKTEVESPVPVIVPYAQCIRFPCLSAPAAAGPL